MVKVYLTFLLLLTSCATKYILPGNRFMTPETNGGALRGQVELQQTTATQLTVDASQGTVNNGVNYDGVSRTAYQLSNSFFDSFDLLWTHTGSANSLIGGKLQLLGGSRTSKAAGHKIGVAAAMGANEHEPEDKSIEFKLGGREFFLMYGYRFSELILPYATLSAATYNFDGTIKRDPVLSGQRPRYESDIRSLNTGIELSYAFLVAKLEASYQQIKTTGTKYKTNTIFGWSLGYAW